MSKNGLFYIKRKVKTLCYTFRKNILNFIESNSINFHTESIRFESKNLKSGTLIEILIMKLSHTILLTTSKSTRWLFNKNNF